MVVREQEVRVHLAANPAPPPLICATATNPAPLRAAYCQSRQEPRWRRGKQRRWQNRCPPSGARPLQAYARRARSMRWSREQNTDHCLVGAPDYRGRCRSGGEGSAGTDRGQVLGGDLRRAQH